MPIPPQVQKIIDKSGNTFHAKVARWFIADKWTVSVSPYYLDQSQQKARELDLLIEKRWPVPGPFGGKIGYVVVRLFVECKFVPDYSVFWFTTKRRAAVEERLCSTGNFRRNNTYTEKHHYLNGDRAAKVFTSSNSRGHETEPFYKALNQVLNGLVSLRFRPSKTSRLPGTGNCILATLDFPVVVCSSFSKLYSADFDGQQETIPIKDNFQLEVEYAYVSRSGQPIEELFLLDFVEYDKLTTFTNALQEDANLAGFFAGGT